MKRPLPAQSKIAAKRVGENLSSWRRLLGLTSQQLANKAAVSRSTISRLENGDPSVGYAAFLNVCRILQVLDDVVEATDPYETDFGRARADEMLPRRVRSSS